MTLANRRNSTGSFTANNNDVALPNTPGRRTLTAARYGGLPRGKSDTDLPSGAAGERETGTAKIENNLLLLELGMEGFGSRLQKFGSSLEEARARIEDIDRRIEEARSAAELEEVACDIDELEVWFDAEDGLDEFFDAETWEDPATESDEGNDEPPPPPPQPVDVPERPILTAQDAAQARVYEAHKIYHEMSRQKEALRTELRVNRLWRAKFNFWRRDPRIKQVREDKNKAKADLDHEIVESEQVLPAYQVMDTRELVATIEHGEATYHRLLREVAPITSAGVGSKTRFKFNFSVGGSLSGLVKAKGGFSISGGVNIQDDRRLRVTSTGGISLEFEVGDADVLGAAFGPEFTRSSTEVFIDAEHWAATVATRARAIKEKLATANLTAQDMYGEQRAAELMEVDRTAKHDPVVKVTSYAGNMSGGGSAFGFGFGAGATRTRRVFERDKADGGKERRTAHETQVTISAERGGWSADAAWTRIKNHANPDNDGHYLNLKVSLSKSAGTSLESLTPEERQEWLAEQQEKLENGLDTSNDEEPESGVQDHPAKGFGSEKLGTLLEQAKVSLEARVSAGTKFTLDLQRGRKHTLEWNYLWNYPEARRLQYSRTSVENSREVSASVEAGAAPVTLGFGVSKDQSTMQNEVLGTETVTYIQTVFDTLRLRDRRDVDVGRAQEGLAQWKAYLAAHRAEIWTLLGKVGSGSGLALEEIQAEAESAQTYASEHQDDSSRVEKAERVASTADTFISACAGQAAALAGIFDQAQFDGLTGQLTDYFEALAQLTGVIQAEKWEPVTR